MAALCGTSPEITQILEALGLKGKTVRSFTLKAAFNEVVTLDVEFLAENIDGGKLASVFKKYKLVEIEGH